MEKILAPADKVLSQIGRFILARPIFSIVLFITALLLTIINDAFFDENTASATAHVFTHHSVQPIALPTVTTPPAVQSIAAPVQPAETVKDNWQVEKVRAGDNLSKIFKRNQISAKDLMAITSLSGAKALRHLQIGEEMRLLVNERRLQQLIYTNENGKTLSIIATDKGLQVGKVGEPAPAASVAATPAPAAQTQATAPAPAAPAPVQAVTPAPVLTQTQVAVPAAVKTTDASVIPAPVKAIPAPTSMTSSTAATTTPAPANAAVSAPAATTTTTSTAPAKAAVTPAATAVPAKVAATNTVTPATIKVNTKAPAAASQPAIAYVSGQVSKSLLTDAKKAGLTTRQANQLIQIFSPKGISKLSAGDQFSVLVQNPNAAATGKKKPSSNILAAQLVHKGKSYQLIRFTDPKGRAAYYTPQGESLQGESISRAPLNYKYISSGFSMHRFDPVLRFVRPHVGVDYAAPYGTPIKAAGDGVIMLAGYKGGYGNTVMIKHDDKYTTLYGHLSKFAANIKSGTAVQQGQVIGYVGSTGFATGAHLHYEIHVNNKPMNPITVALPGVKVPKAYRNQFLAQSKTLLAQLTTNKQVRLAERTDSVKKS